ncbi:MAG: exodeoxyribonuclease VII large subunit, partial [Chromatiaceae bacterium]|nr:exodeoxyribonuclease VII large subunit [Chromatiaceae bacterium]
MPSEPLPQRDIYSVARLNAEVRAVLASGFPLLWVRGELSNLSAPASGHLYFTLKDAAAQVRCALFRTQRQLLRFQPANGQQVLVRARVGLYEPRGDYQLIAEHLEPDGEGAQRLAFEALCQRLAAEGLFAPERKRPLPAFPRQVGLITSPTGAALRDLLAVFGRRWRGLPLLIYPAQVQGEGAVESLIAALGLANQRAECDVLIVARGGGSREDLAAFNDERLARAILASNIPVVTGIGHEIDLGLADLVADQRAATPSAAAELVAPSAAELLQRVAVLRVRLAVAMRRRLEQGRQQQLAVRRHLELLHPRQRLEQQAQRLDRLCWQLEGRLRAWLRARQTAWRSLERRLQAATPEPRLQGARHDLEALEQRLHHRLETRLRQERERLGRSLVALDACSPLATLARGYAIVTRERDGALVRQAEALEAGEGVRLRFERGTVRARIESDA